MPGLRCHLERNPPKITDANAEAESLPLYLPSSLPSAARHNICVKGLADVEDRLRYAQAFESLSELRRQLRTRTLTSKFKSRNVSGQGAYTRTRTLQNGIEDRIRASRVRYCTARDALMQLRGPGDWEKALQVLKPEDVRGMNERGLNAEEKEAYRKARMLLGLPAETLQDIEEELEHATVPAVLSVGEGRRTLSWIWYSVSESEIDSDWTTSLNEGKAPAIFLAELLNN